MVFQDPFGSLNPLRTVRYPLQRALTVYTRPVPAATPSVEELDRLLGQVKLNPVEKFLDGYPHELSGGQRQRVSIARALAAEAAGAAGGRAGVDARRFHPPGDS